MFMKMIKRNIFNSDLDKNKQLLSRYNCNKFLFGIIKKNKFSISK